MSSLYIGLMSGTSLDGVDAAIIDLGGPGPTITASHFLPFPDPLRQAVLALHEPGQDELARAATVSIELSRLYAAAVAAVLAKGAHTARDIRAIGCHGQTVRHRPELGYTLQLGHPALLAELTGITVVADFRSRDIAAGGQGAPLVPAFHAALFSHPTRHRAIVNIGGIANITDLPAGADPAVTGYDTGPGNMLLDAWAALHTGQRYDKDGTWASGGQLVPQLLEAMLADAYFARSAPKSTGRDHFNMAWLQRLQPDALAPQDVQATLLELTARTVATAAGSADEVWLCGGGAHNTALCHRLAALLPDARTGSTEALGLHPDWVEAAAFGWLAKQALEGSAGNLPAVTGARGLRVLGAIYPA